MDAEYTYIEIVVHFGSNSVVVGRVVIPRRHQYTLTPSPVKSRKVPVETVRISRVHLRLVSHLNCAFRKGIEP